MRECIFCGNKADSKEHIWSDWILDILPEAESGKFTSLMPDGTVKSWSISKPKKTVGIVCERACNNGWMSTKLEAPMSAIASDIIVDNHRKTFSASDCKTISAWAFKTAVLLDYSRNRKKHFFQVQQRRSFAKTLSIPSGVHVWIGKRNAGSLTATCKSIWRTQQPPGPLAPHLTTPPPALYGMETYDCVFSVGYLLLQIVATRWANRKVANSLNPPSINQGKFFDNYATQIWPSVGTVRWPPPLSIGNDMIDRFVLRFDELKVPPWML